MCEIRILSAPYGLRFDDVLLAIRLAADKPIEGRKRRITADVIWICIIAVKYTVKNCLCSIINAAPCLLFPRHQTSSKYFRFSERWTCIIQNSATSVQTDKSWFNSIRKIQCPNYKKTYCISMHQIKSAFVQLYGQTDRVYCMQNTKFNCKTASR